VEQTLQKRKNLKNFLSRVTCFSGLLETVLPN